MMCKLSLQVFRTSFDTLLAILAISTLKRKWRRGECRKEPSVLAGYGAPNGRVFIITGQT